jgi:hypothetical protein
MIGLLKKNQKVLLISTTEAIEMYYKALGISKAFETISNASLKDLGGIPNVEKVTFYAVTGVGDEIRKKYLETAYRLSKEF